MRKIITLLLLFLSIILVGCKPKHGINNEVLYDYFLDTKELYTESDSGHIILIVEDDSESSILEFIYNNKDNKIESMKLELNEDGVITEAYVKDGKVYFNVGGEKTYTDINTEAGEDLVAGYWFRELTDTMYKTLNKSIFSASTLLSNDGEDAKLNWDPTKYVFINENYSDEEYFRVEERFNEIKEKMKSIEISIAYKYKLITSLESKWINNDDEESIIKIDFLGTEKQEITYPTDLNSYIAR